MIGLRKLLRSPLVIRGINQQFKISAPVSSIATNKASYSSISSYKNTHRVADVPIRSIYTTKHVCAEVGVVPPFADSISEGDIKWVKQVGDVVEQDDVVAEIETDKTTVPVNSPCAGRISALLVEEGATVQAGAQIFHIEKGEGGASAAPTTEAKAAPPPPPAAEAAPATTVAAPAKPLPPTPPPPTAPTTIPPPKKEPIASMHVAAIKHSDFIQQAVVKVPPSDYREVITGTRTVQDHKIPRMRQRIAQRLKDAQNTYAMLTTFNEVDMGNLIELRKSVKEEFEKKHGVKLSLMSTFLKAAATALTEMPVINAHLEGDHIRYRDYVDISIAVATPKGLVVPVIRNVESMNYADIEKAKKVLEDKARTNSLAVEDMDGGTFTISNGGVFGSLMGTPIINAPQSAILGMHSTQQRYVMRDGQGVWRPMMYLALTYDHRLIDGREAVTFLVRMRNYIQDPRRMMCAL